MINEARQTILAEVRSLEHTGCFACGEIQVDGEMPDDPGAGLGLRCRALADGKVGGWFEPRGWMRGYRDCLQGGIVAALLDSAMTQCLFARNIPAVTGRLEIRFLAPTPIAGRLWVSAALVSVRHGLYELRATLEDQGRRLARASGQFVVRPNCTPPEP